MTEDSQILQSPMASTSQQQHPRRRTKSSEFLINEASKQMKDTFDTLNCILKDRGSEEDECDLYCKLLAKKLRGLPENDRALFMYEIDGMFINRLRNVSSPSPIFSASHYIPQRPISSQSSYTEPLINEMRIRKRSYSSSTSHSEPAIPNKFVPNYTYTTSSQIPFPPLLHYIPAPDRSPISSPQSISQLPVSSHSSYSYPAHIPKQLNTDPNLQPVNSSSSVTVLSDQILVSPVRNYLGNFNNRK